MTGAVINPVEALRGADRINDTVVSVAARRRRCFEYLLEEREGGSKERKRRGEESISPASFPICRLRHVQPGLSLSARQKQVSALMRMLAG